jgi:hypothetical protein
MIAEGKNELSPVYSAWFGKPVVLVIGLRQCHVPVPCSIIGESARELRVRVKAGWEMDLGKEWILAIEEETVPPSSRVN